MGFFGEFFRNFLVIFWEFLGILFWEILGIFFEEFLWKDFLGGILTFLKSAKLFEYGRN